MIAGVERDDLVLVNNITFYCLGQLNSYTGAQPVLVDVDPQTWQMDLGLLDEFLEKKTKVVRGACIHKQSRKRIKAIMPVSCFGHMVRDVGVLSLAKKYSLRLWKIQRKHWEHGIMKTCWYFWKA